jgi:hypothetical protein
MERTQGFEVALGPISGGLVAKRSLAQGENFIFRDAGTELTQLFRWIEKRPHLI